MPAPERANATRASTWHSSARSSTRSRESRVVLWGMAIVAIAVFVARGVIPFAAQWRAREARIEALRERGARLLALSAQERALAAAADSAEARLANAPRRVLHAASPALASSVMQGFIEDATTGAGLVVSRIESAPEGTADGAPGGAPDGAPGGGTPAVSASLSAVGDVHGLAALLSTLTTGPRVVQLTRLSVTQTTALRGAPEVLQLSLVVRAPFIAAAGAQP